MRLLTKLDTVQQGFSLIEVLVTMVIVAVGLLGVLGLQAKATNSEFESYQRGQALAIARDMQNRLTTSRGNIANYTTLGLSSTDGSVSVGYDDPAVDCTTLAGARRNMCEWRELLKGSDIKEGTRNVGAMIGARGCLIRVTPAQGNALADIYVTVVWQGIVPGSEPQADSPAAMCASTTTNYGAGLRRGLSVRVLVPDLEQDSMSGGRNDTEP